MSYSTQKSILIIEQEKPLAIPIEIFPKSCQLLFVSTLSEVTFVFKQQRIDIIFLSASQATHQLVSTLEYLAEICRPILIPIVLVVDFQQTLTTIPGTTWAERIGIVHALTSKAELRATLTRLVGYVD